MGKIKILHILNAVSGVGVHLQLLLNHLDPEQFEQVIVHCDNDSITNPTDKLGTPLRHYTLSFQRNIHLINDFKTYLQLKPIIKKERPDIIHGHSAKGGVFAKLIGHKFNIPVWHTPHAYSYLSAESDLKRKLYLSIERYFARYNNGILACSDSEKQRAIQDVGYPENRVRVFNNSIESIEELPPLETPKTWPDQYICSVGRPSYQKNIELMVEVIRVLKTMQPDIHLVLMGVGFHSPNLAAIKAKIKTYQLDKHITLLNWTKRSDILNIVKQSQLYLSTARYEGLSYAIIEAMGVSKTSVVSDVDGNRDLIQSGHNGFVISDDNPGAYAQKIDTILNDEALKLKFETQAFADFQAHYNISTTIPLLEQIYKQTPSNLKTH